MRAGVRILTATIAAVFPAMAQAGASLDGKLGVAASVGGEKTLSVILPAVETAVEIDLTERVGLWVGAGLAFNRNNAFASQSSSGGSCPEGLPILAMPDAGQLVCSGAEDFMLVTFETGVAMDLALGPGELGGLFGAGLSVLDPSPSDASGIGGSLSVSGRYLFDRVSNGLDIGVGAGLRLHLPWMVPVVHVAAIFQHDFL